MSLFIILAVLIVVVLAVIAWSLQNKVHIMEQHKQEQREAANKTKLEHQQYINNSIQILAQSLLDDQVSMTEGAIRISVLMGNLDLGEEQRQEFDVFFKLAEETAHIPILDAWQALSKQEKRCFERERSDIESKYQQAIADAATGIKGRCF